MSKVVYVLSYQGEPDHVYTSLEPLIKMCYKYMNEHRCAEEKMFNYWLEDRFYTEDTAEQAWNDYVDWIFDYGKWGDYSYIEVLLD